MIHALSRQVPDDWRSEDGYGPHRWDEKPDVTHEKWLDAKGNYFTYSGNMRMWIATGILRRTENNPNMLEK
jgi:hypothetical protein